MNKPIMQAVVVFVISFAAAQLVRPDRTNPVTDPGSTIRAHAGTASGLPPILERACGDCHSNATVWPSYTQVAPLSWLMAYAVTSGKMPSVYTLLRPETRLSAQEIGTICAAARGTDATAAADRRQP